MALAGAENRLAGVCDKKAGYVGRGRQSGRLPSCGGWGRWALDEALRKRGAGELLAGTTGQG